MPIDDDDLTALLPPLDPAPGPSLAGGLTADGLRFAGLDLTGDATDARFLECEIADCDLDGVVFDRARFSVCRLADVRADAVSLIDATWTDVVLTGGRFGALTAHGAGLSRVHVHEVKADFADLRGGTLHDVTFAGCAFRELDVTDADLRAVRFGDCEIGSLVLRGARTRDVDLRGARIERLDGVADLAGCTISEAQLGAWAGGLAAHLGIRVG